MYRGPGDKIGGRSIAPEHFANLICDPPLGQTTVIEDSQRNVKFTVLIESELEPGEPELEAVIWHNLTSSDDWTELKLESTTDSSPASFFEGESVRQVHRRYFTGELRGQSGSTGPFSFTVKFRSGKESPWQWVNDNFSLKDGELIFLSPLSDSKDLGDYIGNISDLVKVESESSEALNTRLWSLEAPIIAAEGPKSGSTHVVLGRPRSFTRWMALVRIWSPWLAPEQGRSTFAPNKDVVLCSFLLQDGLNLVLLALSGIDDVLTLLKADGEGNVVISARNDSTDKGVAKVLASVGPDYDSAVGAVMYHARRVVTDALVLKDEVQAEIKAATDAVKPEWLQNWYDGLTYCTWNGLGQNLTEKLIFDALDSLKENNVDITNLIIDDNWQSLDNEGASQFRRGWTDFDANKEGFPQGLKQSVSQIREKHPHIQHISVWHAILGYWGGIAPKGNISQNYKTVDVSMKTGVRPPGGPMRVVDEADVSRLYEDFYRFLSDCGVDSVKTDAQFFLDELEDADVRRRLIKTYQDAWTVSSLKWFSIKTISCMSQTPQILFHSQLPTNKPPILVRNSDDFFPEIPASHPWHIFCNAHNSLITQYLNLLPDWDMFQTSHPWATFHAAARCLSGGPIYITDEPGRHNIDLIHQMTARTTRGNTVIIRPQNVGKTTLQYVHYDEDRLLRIGTYTGPQKYGTGILGFFNISQCALTEIIPLKDFPGTTKGQEYVVRAHSSGGLSDLLQVDQSTSLVGLRVPIQGCEILSAYSIHSFLLKDGGACGGSDPSQRLKIANLGLVGKMTGAAAVLRTDFTVTGSGSLKMQTSLKALGVLGIYISDLATRSIETEFMVMILERAVPLETVRKCRSSSKVLEIDVAKAWTDMDLNAGWSNEVAVTIIINGSAIASA
ncbi:MAG: hypothetical protein M1837_002422 [Sclerophora amabilis]|nr:MAG: hypothetical protein M1837_002422 [Sclerophora amabilis]